MASLQRPHFWIVVSALAQTLHAGAEDDILRGNWLLGMRFLVEKLERKNTKKMKKR